MRECESPVLFFWCIFLGFFILSLCSPILLADYYLISAPDLQPGQVVAVFIRTDGRLDVDWLRQSTGYNVQEVSFNDIQARDAPYFIFSEGISRRNLSSIEYSRYQTSAIQALLLVMANRRFYPPGRSDLNEALTEDQQDLFFSVDLSDLAVLADEVGMLADRFQSEGTITGWHFRRLIIRDESRVSIRVRISAQDHDLVLQEFREYFPTLAVQYLRSDSDSTQSCPAVSGRQEMIRCYVSQVDYGEARFITYTLSRNRLHFFQTTHYTPDSSNSQSFIVRFNVRADELQMIAQPSWLKNIRRFVGGVQNPGGAAAEGTRHFRWHLERMDDARHLRNGIALVLSFGLIINTGNNNQDIIVSSAQSAQNDVLAVIPRTPLQIRWDFPARQELRPILFREGLRSVLLREELLYKF